MDSWLLVWAAGSVVFPFAKVGDTIINWELGVRKLCSVLDVMNTCETAKRKSSVGTRM